MSSVGERAAQDLSIAGAYAQRGRAEVRKWRQVLAEKDARGAPRGSRWTPVRALAGLLWEWSWGLRGALARAIDTSITWINSIFQPVEQVFGWSLSVVAWPILAVLQLPYVGRSLHWMLALLQGLFWLAASLPDGALSLAGVLPEKQLRVGFVSLSSSSPKRDELEQAIRAAGLILRLQANVRLLVTHEFGATDRSKSWTDLPADQVWIHEVPVEMEIEAGCHAKAFSGDLSGRGTQFGRAVVEGDQFGLWRRLIGVGSPITVLLVDSVGKGDLLGCSLGPLADYVTLTGSDPRCLAHELGHACNLWHLRDSENLMFHHCGRTELRRWQVALLRMSRHVSYM